MLIRILLAVEDLGVRRRFKSVLKSSDVITSTARLRGDFWQILSRASCDLFVLEKDLVPAPATGTIARLRELPGFSQSALAALTDYAWPGNVRELIAVVERAVLLSGETEITTEDLPETIAEATARLDSRAEPGSPAGGMNRTPWESRMNGWSFRGPKRERTSSTPSSEST